MAFDAQEKADLLFYLGYSGMEDDGPAMRAINSLDAHEDTMGARLRDLLAKLRDIDTEIHAVRPLAVAVEDGSVKLRAAYSLAVLRDMGRQYAANLGRWAKVAISNDVFSPGGPVRNSAAFYSGDPSEHRINPAYGVPTIGVK